MFLGVLDDEAEDDDEVGVELDRVVAAAAAGLAADGVYMSVDTNVCSCEPMSLGVIENASAEEGSASRARMSGELNRSSSSSSPNKDTGCCCCCC